MLINERREATTARSEGDALQVHQRVESRLSGSERRSLSVHSPTTYRPISLERDIVSAERGSGISSSQGGYKAGRLSTNDGALQSNTESPRREITESLSVQISGDPEAHAAATLE